MSLYIRLRTSFWNHRKTVRLQLAIGSDAYWLPPRLWSYAAEHQPDGDFSGYSADDLKAILYYSGDATSMLQALQVTGFMDEMKIHGWEEHNGFHSTFSNRAKIAAEARWMKVKKEKNQKKERVQGNRKRKGASMTQALLTHASSMLPKCLNNNEFCSEWKEFVKYRQEKRAPMTERAAHLMLKALAEQPSRAVEALQTAIKRNWTGFEWSWLDRNGATTNSEPRMTPHERDAKIHALNQRKRDLIRQYGNFVGENPELEQIEKQLRAL